MASRIWYFTADEHGYLDAKSSTSMRRDDEISLSIPDDHPIHNDNYMVYRYVDGELVKDVAYQDRLIEEEQEKLSKPSIEDQLSIALLEMNEKIYKLEGGG